MTDLEKQMLAALVNADMWLGRLIADGGHKQCVAPLHAENTLDQVEAVIKKAKAQDQ